MGLTRGFIWQFCSSSEVEIENCCGFGEEDSGGFALEDLREENFKVNW